MKANPLSRLHTRQSCVEPLESRIAPATITSSTPGSFTDSDGDLYKIVLSGSGSAEVTIDDLDGDTHGSIMSILLTGTTEKSKLSVLVTKKTGGDGEVAIGSLTGNIPLGAFTAAKSDLTGTGIGITGALLSATVGDVLNGADIIFGGVATSKTRLTLGTVGDNTTITSGLTVSTLTAKSIGDGLIQAPAIGSLKTTAGGLASDIAVVGGIGPMLIASGGASGAWTAASFGAIKVGGDFAADVVSTATAAVLGKTFALSSLTVTKGNFTGDITTLGKAGSFNIIGDKMGLTGRVLNSAIDIGAEFAGITARSMVGAVIEAASFKRIATTGGPLDSDITAAGSLGVISVAGGATYGTWIGGSATSVSVSGANFGAHLFLGTPAPVLGKKLALSALTITNGDLVGDIGALGSIGTLNFRKGKSATGSIIGATVTAAGIKVINVAGSVTDSAILAGANFGLNFEYDPGDSFGAGSIGSFKVKGDVTASVIGAGLFSNDAELNDDDAGLLGGEESTVKSFSVGAADAASFFAAVKFPGKVKIGKTLVAPPTDARFLTTGSVDSRAPGVTAGLMADTGASSTDAITNNPVVIGRIADNGGEPVLRASVGAGAFADVSDKITLDGSFTLDIDQLTTLHGGPLLDGVYSVHVLGSDAAGNDAAPITITFTLDRTAPTAPTLDLTAGSDTGLVGDNLTSAGVVTLTGVAEEGLTVTVGTRTALAGAGGAYTVADVPLTNGDNLFVAQVTDVAGNTAETMRTITRSGSPANPNVVLEWNQVNLEAIRLDASAPTFATRSLAMASGAMFDVVNAFEGKTGFFLTTSAPDGASLEAATAAAAYTVLLAAFPGQKALFDATLATTLARVPDGASETDGVAFGGQIGATVIALRSQDGYDQYVDYSPGSEVGDWQQTGPMFAPALAPQWATLEPFLMAAPNQFRPDAPPALDSPEYALALNEVKELGVATGGSRTATETQIARFWADGPGTYSPPGHWNQLAIQFAQAGGFSISSNARLLAELNLALADAAIVAWDAKYAYNTWRPETAIQNADIDGNAQTAPDDAWRPLLIAPPFPEYVSGHAAFSAAAADILESVFGSATAFNLTSLGLPGVTRSFANFDAAAAEAGRSRIFGGIHFEFANQAGQAAGRELASFALARFEANGDFAAPTLLLDATPGGAVKAADFNVTGRLLDNISGVASFTALLDNGSAEPVTLAVDGTFLLPVAITGLAQGAHTITFAASDVAGNAIVPKTFTFTIDSLNPTLALSPSLEGATLDVASLLTGTADGTGSALVSLKYAFDGGTARSINYDAAGAFSQQFDLSELGAGAHALAVMATDAAGQTTTQNFNVSLAAPIPFIVTGATPEDTSEDVGTTFRPQVHFSRAVNPATLNANNFYATAPDGTKLPATIVPADGGSFAWLFVTSPMPGGSRITVTVDGATILAADGTPLDADFNGAAGGVFNYAFTTVSSSPATGTTLSGTVLDPGADLKPMTFDDLRAGADGILHTADDVFLSRLIGVKVYILGRESDAVFTDNQGNFTLINVPSGNVKLAIEGNTTLNAPTGFYFPEMVMDLTIRAGVANTVMDTMGTLEQEQANAGRKEIYLPRLRTTILQDVGGAGNTMVGVDAASAPNLTDAQRGQLALEVQPGSLLGADGQPLLNPRVGISTVPPELVREMLPPGVLQHTFDITIQAPGAAVFDTPLEMTFPNVFNAAPGTKLSFLSFDHTTGRLVIEGTATVNADGLSVTTDPGSGITKPGWHGLTPPGDCVGAGTPPKPPKPPTPMDTHIVNPATAFTMIRGEAGPSNFTTFQWKAPERIPDPMDKPPAPADPCEVPALPPDPNQVQPYVTVIIDVDGPLSTFMKQTGNLGLASQSFTLQAGSNEVKTLGAVQKTYAELFPGGFQNLTRDQLFGARIKITEIHGMPDGSRQITESTYYQYEWVSVVRPDEAKVHGGSSALFMRTNTDGIVRTKRVDYHLPTALTSFEGNAVSDFAYGGSVTSEGTAVWNFDPSATGFRSDMVKLNVADPTNPTLNAGSISVFGKGTASTTININLPGYITELTHVITTLKFAYEPGNDGKPGIEGRDDDGVKGVDNIEEYGAPGSDDRIELLYFFDRGGSPVGTFIAGPDGRPGLAGIDDNANGLIDDASEFGMGGDPFLPAVDPTKLTDINGKSAYVIVGNHFKQEFANFLPGKTFDGAQLAAFLDGKAQELRDAVLADYSPANTDINAYQFVETGGDVTMMWDDIYSATSKSLIYGSADADRDTSAATANILKDPALPEAAKQWELAESLNLNVNNVGRFAVGINVSWDSNATFAQFVANTVSHEVGHTFGLPDAYQSDPFKNINPPGDIMQGGSNEDPDLSFVLTNIALLKAALGVQRNADLPLSTALKMYKKNFNLATSEAGIRENTPDDTFQGGAALLITTADDVVLPNNSIELPNTVADGPGGQYFDQQFTLKNVGFQTLTIAQTTLTADFQDLYYSFPGQSLAGTSLEPGESVTLTVRFDPEATGLNSAGGVFSANLSVLSNSEVNSTYSVSISSLSTPATPTASVDLFAPNNLGGLELGAPMTSSPSIFRIVNDGAQPLTLTSIQLADATGQFGLLGVPADIATNPIVLDLGESFTFGGTFDASTLGLQMGRVTILTNDPSQPMLTLSLVGTGVDALPYPQWGNDFVAVQTNTTLRATSNDKGDFSFFLPSDTNYEALIFDPATGLVTSNFGATGASGRGLDITASMVFLASTAADTDFDGLPDDIERAVGCGIGNGDTDHDGLSDFAEVMRGLDPLGARSIPVGVVSAVAMAGDARDLVTAALANDPATHLAYVAAGTGGLAIVDVSDVSKPTLLSQFSLPGIANDVALDPLLGIAVVVANAGGAHFMDVGNPSKPNLLRTVNINATQVEIGNGMVFVAAGGFLRTYDIFSGDLVQTVNVGPNTITGLALDGTSLFTMESGGTNTLRAFDFAGGNLVARDTLALPSGGGKVFAGDGVVYVSGNVGGAGGFATVNAANLNDITLISGVDNNALGGTAFVKGGSRFGATIGHSDFAFGLFRAVDVMDVSDPANTGTFITRINLPDRPLGIAIGDGIAFVADGAGDLQVVNFLSPDVANVLPTVQLITAGIDADPGTPGTQIVEGTSFPIRVNASDDVGISQVDFLVNGISIASDTSFPFDFATLAPPLAMGSTLTLQARATDLAGNVSLSAPQIATVVSDTFAPTLVRQTPGDGAARTQQFRTVVLTFSEAMDPSDFTTDSLHLSGPGGVNVPPDSIEMRSGGRQVRVELPVLAAGGYTFTIDRNEISDIGSNPLGPGPTSTTFQIVNATIEWINPAGGEWSNGANWNTGQVPTAADDAFIGLDDDFTVTVSGAGFTVNRLFLDETFSIFSALTVNSGTLANFHDLLMQQGSLTASLLNHGVVSINGNATLAGTVANAADGIIHVGIGNGGNLTLNADATNDGLIELAASNTSSSSSSITMGAANTMTNHGTLRSMGAGPGSLRVFSGALINDGLVDVVNSLDHQHPSRPVNLEGGTVNIASGMKYTSQGGTTTLGSGTMFTGSGTVEFTNTQTVTLASDFTNPASIAAMTNFGSLTWNGPGALINAGTFVINGDTLNIAVTNSGTFTVQGGTSSVGAFNNLASGIVRLETNTSGTITLNVNGDAMNAGLIEINGALTGASGTIAMSATSTFTNSGIVRTLTAGGTRNLNGAVINHGTLDALESLNMIHPGRTVDFNGGTANVAAGKTLDVSQGTTTLGNTAIFTGAGTVNFSGGSHTVNLTSDFTFSPTTGTMSNSGTITWNGPGVLINAGTFIVNTDTLNVAVTNSGIFAMQGGTCTVGGLFTNTPTGTLRLETNTTGTLTLNLNGDAMNAGLVEINGASSGATGTLAMGASSTFTNTGIVRTLTAGGTRNFNGAVINNGTIDVLETLNMSHAGRTVDFNGGTVNVSAGKTLDVGSGTTTLGSTAVFTGPGTVNFSGGSQTVNLTSDFTFSPTTGTMTNSGTITWNGPGVLINAGTFIVNTDTLNIAVTNSGVFAMQGGTCTVGGLFTNNAAGTLRLETNTGTNTLNLDGNVMNAGLVEINGASSGASGTLAMGASSTFTNMGTVRSQTAGGNRNFNGAVINNGTIDVLENLNMTHPGRIVDFNGGTANVAAGKTLDVGTGASTMGSASLGSNALFTGTGTVNFSGAGQAVNLTSDFTNPASLAAISNSGTLTWAGPGVLLNSGRFVINGDTLNVAVSNSGVFAAQGGTSSISQLFTNLAAGTLRLETNTGTTTLNLNGDAVSTGLVEINGASSGASGTLAMGATSTFTNGGGGIIRSQTAGGARAFNGAVINNGMIDILENLTMTHTSRTVDFVGGTVSVSAGKTLDVSGGTSTLGTTAAFTGAGTFNFGGTQTVNLASDFTVPAALGAMTNGGAVTWNGPGMLFNAGNFAISGDTINVAVSNSAIFNVQGGTSALNLAFTNTATGTWRFETSTGTNVVNLNANAVNDGLIEINGASSGASATLNIAATFTLTNNGILRAQTAGGNRTISGSIVNTGSMEVLESLTLNHAAASVFNCTAGTINIAAGKTFTINGGTTQMASTTTLLGTGTLTFGGTQTLSLASNVTRGGITTSIGASVTQPGPGIFV